MMEKSKRNELFPLWQRLLVFFIPVVIPVHIYFAAKKFELGGKELRDEYYRVLQYGYLFYLVVLFVVVFTTRQ